MIKVGIVGCGKIADAHASQILRIPDCKIVGVCDKEWLMAKQLYERYNVQRYFDNIEELLEIARPDVIHITTPPQSHYKLGKLCLESGCNIYIEKPFTLYAEEAEKLIQLANDKNLKVTVGHDYQFTPAARRMRELIGNGYLGGRPVHMESYYCYDLGDVSYAKAMLGDKDHWVRTLPGKLLHNIISHGISKIAEYISGDQPKVIAHGFTSPFLRELNEYDIIDELRVIINDNDCATAYFTFSSQMRPVLHHFRTYGLKNALMMDHEHQTLIKVSGTKYKSYLDKFIPPYVFAKQYMLNSITNIGQFLRNDFHMAAGMKFLIESFYKSIINNTPLPISYKEIMMTAKIMDSIFEQIYRRQTLMR